MSTEGSIWGLWVLILNPEIIIALFTKELFTKEQQSLSNKYIYSPWTQDNIIYPKMTQHFYFFMLQYIIYFFFHLHSWLYLPDVFIISLLLHRHITVTLQYVGCGTQDRHTAACHFHTCVSISFLLLSLKQQVSYLVLCSSLVGCEFTHPVQQQRRPL